MILLRDDKSLYPILLDEMLHEYVVSDTFCGRSRQDREERIGAFEEIKALIESMITPEYQEDTKEKIA